MARKKMPRWSVRFELAPENEPDVRLHEYLNGLAEQGTASDWIRRTLFEALPSLTNGVPTNVDKPVIKSVSTVPATQPPPIGRDHFKDMKRVPYDTEVTELKSPEEVVQELPAQAMGLTPAEILRQRKLAAQTKLNKSLPNPGAK